MTQHLSHGQRRLWFMARTEPESPAYNIPLAMHLAGDVDRTALARAVRDLATRHEVLRTHIRVVDGEPVLDVVAPGDLPELVRCMTRVSDPDATMRRLAVEPFDLSEELPIRVHLIAEPGGWILLIVVHHIAADGISMAPLARDLGEAYAAHRDRTPWTREPLEVQYADFAAWQRELLGDIHDPDSLAHEQTEYWRTRLAGAPQDTELSLATARPAVATGKGSRVFVTVPAALRDRLRDLERGLGCTPHMLNQALVAALASRFGVDDVVLGTQVAGRDEEGLDDLVGLFVNTLAMRHRVSASTTFAELCDDVRGATLEGLEHADLPFDVLVEQLNPARTMNRHPVFQIGVAARQGDDIDLDLGVPATAVTDLDLGTSQFDLNFCLFDRTDGSAEIEVEFSSDVYDEARARYLGRAWCELAAGVSTHPDASISELGVVPADIVDQVTAWGIGEPCPEPVRFIEFFDHAVATHPTGIAVEEGARTLTYADLDVRVETLARGLHALGARPGAVVAVSLPKSIDAVVAILAVCRTGAAYLPIDPAQPDNRIRYMVEDAEPIAVITDSVNRRRFGSLPVVDTTSAMEVTGPVTWPVPEISEVAYVIYTSGSTGRPKGVEVTHSGLAGTVASQVRGFGLDGSLKLLQLASFSFDVSVIDLLTVFAVAGTVVLPGEGVVAGDDLARLLHHHRITYCELTPSRLQSLEPGAFEQLRNINLSGEACPAQLVRAWAGERRILNTYGPTEVTVTSVVSWPLDGLREPEIGHPTDGLVARVLDDRLRPVAPGVPGELYLSGPGLARGYRRRPGLTASRFVADLDAPGERMYRTGDVVRWRADGELEFIGRSDDQVKVRGLRIELGEIESEVTAVEGVRAAAVIVREDTPGDQRIVAYVVGEVDGAGIKRRVARQLPAYMVPSAVVILDALPLTVSGKLDVRALPAPTVENPGPGRRPATPREEAACRCFAETLGLDEVHTDQSFFDLGGHSLLATRLVGRWQETVGGSITLRDVFEAPTPLGLLDRSVVEAASQPDLVPCERHGDVPPSAAQRRMWFLSTRDGAAAYNVPIVLQVAGRLDEGVLQAALNDLAGRHESLRTIFPDVDGTPYQRVLPAGTPVPLDVVEADDADEVDAILARTARESFDLGREIPLRATVVRGRTRDVLALVLHHIATDGWSLTPLARDLGLAYAARDRGTAPDWEPLPVQYADYTEWLRRRTGTDGQGDGPEYWARALADLPAAIPLPCGRNRPAQPTNAGSWVPFSIDAELHRRIDDLAHECEVTTFMVLQAATALTLRLLGAGDDIPLGTMVAGRERKELSDLIGFFINTVVLRTDVSGNPAFRDLLTRVREADLDAFDHQDVPFETVVEELQPEREPGRHPLFQVALTVMTANSEPEWSLGSLPVTVLGQDSQFSRFDLTFSLDEHRVDDEAAGMTGTIDYATELFDEADVEQLGQRVLSVLRQVVADPSMRFSQATVVLPSETGWERETGEPVAHLATFPELFSRQVAADPTRIAVECGDQRITFAELDEQSTRWARVLAGLGVGPETVVASCLPRSAFSIVALLAIMKAGGVWQPVDPAHPDEHINFLLGDSGAALVLCEEASAHRFAPPTLAVDSPETADLLSAATAVPAGPSGVYGAAYIIHTSGSTGRPRGVVVSHAGLAGLAQGYALYGITPASVAMQFASHSFDGAVSEIGMSLLAGATMVMVPEQERNLGPGCARILQRCTHAFLTPASVLALGASNIPSGLTLLVGGEAFPAQLVDEIGQRVRLFNVYGPTETTVDISYHPVNDRDVDPVPIGHPVPAKTVTVLDEFLHPVPVGCIGELYVSGAALARGYAGRPGATASRFVADPDGSGERMYRTGDLVRRGRDGALRFIGRADDQVKIRGFRIELGEVEAALAALPGVTAAAAMARRDLGPDAVLVGYLVGDIDPVAARRILAAGLPKQAVPDHIVMLDALPLTRNGKVDRKALPVPVVATRSGRVPSTPAEEQACAALAAVLGVDEVGVDDNFFELGGHSLLAVRLVSRLRGAGFTITISDLFADPVPRAWARFAGDGPATGTVRAVSRPADGMLPASRAQRRLWLEQDLVTDPVAYNLPVVLDVSVLDMEALRSALGDVTGRHEALRTLVVERDGDPWQRIMTSTEAMARIPERIHVVPDPDAFTTALSSGLDISAEIPLRVVVLPRAGGGRIGLVFHHIAIDGSSIAPLLRDLSYAYGCRQNGEEPSWRRPGLQPADWAAAQEHILGDADDPDSLTARETAWWRARLADAPARSGLPGMSSTEKGVAAPRMIRADVSMATLNGLRALARREGATLFMVVHAAFTALLSRLGAGPDLVLGTVTAGRDDAALEETVGFFVNPIALRTRLAGDPSFVDWLAEVRRRDAEALAHARVPFDDVVAALRQERVPGRHPVFQTLLTSFEDRGPVDVEIPFGTGRARLVEDGLASAKFDLTIAFGQVGSGLALELEFATDRYDVNTVEQLAARFSRVLHQLAKDPSTTVSGLDVLLPGELDSLRAMGSSAPEPEVPAMGLDDLFASAHALVGGDAPAVTGDRELTYADLERESRWWAHRLLAEGVRRGDVVGVCVPRSADMIVAVLAVARTGAALLPLDATYPTARLTQVTADAAPRLILARGAGVSAMTASCDLPVLEMGSPDPGEPGPLPPRVLAAEEPVYVIHTSGSTGRPKGVCMTRRGLGVFTRSLTRRIGAWPGIRVLQAASLSFDAAIMELCMAWGAGGSLVIPEPGPLAGDELRTALEHVDAALLTPSVLTTLDTPLDGVPVLVAGAEALSADLVARLAPGRTLFNAYGPTEATIAVAVAGPLSPSPGQEAPPIGRGLDAVRLVVLDDFLQPVPPGVPGELYIGGPGLAIGYLNRPGLTASRFVADPFRQGEVLYRTGDVVAWNRSWELTYLGRADSQLKVRGFRVEPGEIERCLADVPGVTGAVVIEAPDSPGRLVGYVTGEDVDTTAVRSRAEAVLPPHMVPAVIMALDSFPRTPNGKLDRRALPPATVAPTSQEPATALEAQVCAVFAEALGVDVVGPEDNFFLLGGHSLSAARIVSRLGGPEKRLRLRDVFEAPTARALAARLEPAHDTVAPAGSRHDALEGPHGLPAGPVPDIRAGGERIVHRPRPEQLPASFAQRRLWTVTRLEGASSAYNIPLVARLRGVLDVPALQQALRDVVERQDTLRTVMIPIDGEPFQRLMAVPEASDLCTVLDVSGLDEQERLALVKEYSARPFDLERDLPIRAWVLREAVDSHIVVLVMHHIASDGLSLAPLLHDLQDAYAARRAGRAPAWIPLPVTYADHTLRQHERSAGQGEEIEWWRATLAGLPEETRLPGEKPGTSSGARPSGTVEGVLPAEALSRVQHLASEHGASVFMVCHAAVAVLLNRLGAGEDVVLGAVTAGRGDSALEPLVGFFVNTLAIRHDLTGNPTVAATIDRAREAILGAVEHSRVPFDMVVDAVAPSRVPGRHPLFQVMVNHMSESGGNTARLTLPGVETEDLHPGPLGAKFDLDFSVGEVPGPDGTELSIQLDYATDRLDARAAGDIVTRLLRVLEALGTDANRRISAIDVLSDEERDAAVRTGPVAGQPRTFSELFAEAVRIDPDHDAVRCGGDVLTYAELDAASNQFARWLIQRGIGAEDIVALSLRKSVRAVVAIVGVEKAGAAYVPIDPDHPVERISYLLNDSGADLVITTAADANRFDAAVLLDAPDTVADIDACDDGPIRVGELRVPPSTDHPCYLIHTSGSTGRPKGVVVTHRGLAALAASQRAGQGAGPDETMLLFASFSFDASVSELTMALFHGACLVLVPEELRAPDAALGDYLRRHDVRRAIFVPTTLRALPKDCLPPRLALMVAGEALPAATVADEVGRRPVLNLYGPTETTIDVTRYRLDGSETGMVPIGEVVHGLSVAVLDEHLRPVPPGAVGELYVSGVGLARGYHRRPGLTASRFVAATWGEPGAVMYRTGDLVRLRPDGFYEFVSRSDRQIKIRGFRVEPGEIEQALLAVDGVLAAHVGALHVGDDESRLVAWVAAPPADTFDTEACRLALADVLPAHAIPASIVAMDAFPATAHGKLDGARLPVPDWGNQRDHVDPEDGVEALLAEIWTEAFADGRRVGALDNFFGSGGNSLLAAKVAARVNDRLAVDLPLRTIFEVPVLRDQAAILEAILLAELEEEPAS